MSDGWLIVCWFFSSVFLSALAIWKCVVAARRRIVGWDSSSTIWFIMTIGNFGDRQIDVWKRRGGYDEIQAKIIIRFQMLCLLGIVLAAIASTAAIMEYKVLGHEREIRATLGTK
jgi:hypothetical protein